MNCVGVRDGVCWEAGASQAAKLSTLRRTTVALVNFQDKEKELMRAKSQERKGMWVTQYLDFALPFNSEEKLHKFRQISDVADLISNVNFSRIQRQKPGQR